MGKDLGIVGKFEYLCTNPRIRRQLLTQLNDFAKSEGLKNYELPKNVYLEPVSFRTQGILTDTTKLLRYAAKKLYAGQINAMYREGMFVDKEL
jgi:long-subunit acyl-CoA synthetase (AMP-forming)